MSDLKPNPMPDRTAAAPSIPPLTGTGSDPLVPPTAGASASVPGRLGEYVLLGELGRGGMGVVYRAEDPHLKREVALKVMLPDFAANPTAKARFVREARAQAKVEHDHVAAIHRVAEQDGLPYLVMPLLKGMTLHTALRANPRPPLGEVIRIAREVAEGLAAAHEKGLVHRDIKPANIWLEGKKLRVKVLDFGLARIADAGSDAESATGPVTREGAVLGTPAYMSPEQGRGLVVDGRTDLWSLGVVLYQMTTGEMPFTGATQLALLTSLALDNPPPPILKNPTVPPALSDLVLRLLSKDPAGRPPTAEVLVEELRAIEMGMVNAVRVIPLDAPPLIVGTEGPDPFADLDATEMSIAEAEDKPLAASQATRGFPMWAMVAGVLLAVAGVVAFAISQMGKKPVDVVQPDDPPDSRDPKGSAPEPPKPGEVFILKYGNPQVEMKFRWIPPGTLPLGGDKVASIKGFWMAETETTQAQWRAVMKERPDPSNFKGDNLPVEQVSWDEAKEFCEKLTKLVGDRIQLPSESEWEYACRAGTKTEYHSGDGEEALQKVGWYGRNAGGKTHPVGELAANAWGLRDMHGNVWEWCSDLSDNGSSRAIRSGGWGSVLASDCRPASRIAFAPSYRLHDLGFRVARVPSGSTVTSAAKDPDRLAAEYVLGIGGTVRINDFRVIKVVGELPATPFQVVHLDLGRNKQVTDAGLAACKDCKNLTYLRLNNTQVGDAGVAYFKDCKNLTELVLHDTQVSDAGLKELADKSKLTVLDLRKTRLTEAGVKQLAAALPECRIFWDGGTIEPKKP